MAHLRGCVGPAGSSWEIVSIPVHIHRREWDVTWTTGWEDKEDPYICIPEGIVLPPNAQQTIMRKYKNQQRFKRQRLMR
jgi:hypothetical protein